MSFRPEDYPGEKPEEWYDKWPGMIVGHVSLLRDMLKPEWVRPAHCVPKIFFPVGDWVGGYWVESSAVGRGIVLGLDEHNPDDPTVTLGDYLVLDTEDGDPNGRIINREDIAVISLKRIGPMIGAAAPPEMWKED
ncbi:hypothetical protein IPP75_00480 [Candidatus Saccharibacteria bacterium]|nr:MAG: hypothetical protein IPP75_00480 [Candidatus Saccharibacteria bacterium]